MKISSFSIFFCFNSVNIEYAPGLDTFANNLNTNKQSTTGPMSNQDTQLYY